ncbi:MAG: hypothetical protein H6Q59_1089 [Firmicutes bacterium]|nr:hypothetical protein [Bacillota bacterium]
MDLNNFLTEYWNYIAEQNEEQLRKYFHKDACIQWHGTNERFNVDEFMRANCDYPGSWNSAVERIEHMESSIITVTRVWSSECSFHVTSFFKLEDNKIQVLDEYWCEDGIAPQWRIDKQIGKPIRLMTYSLGGRLNEG